MKTRIYEKKCHIEYMRKVFKVVDGVTVVTEVPDVITSQVVCNNPLVEKVWLVGYLTNFEKGKEEAAIRLEMLFKNGNRFSLNKRDMFPEGFKLRKNASLEKAYYKKAAEYLDNGGVGIEYKMPISNSSYGCEVAKKMQELLNNGYKQAFGDERDINKETQNKK